MQVANHRCATLGRLLRGGGAAWWHQRPCTVRAAKGKGEMSWVSAENREEVMHVLEVAERAAARWDITVTDFLSPAVAGDAMACLQGRGDITAVPWGGFAQAERCR